MRWIIAATLGFASIFPSPSSGQRMLIATPSVPQFDSAGHAELTLTWRVPSATVTQIRLDAPEGEVFAEGGPSGRAHTGRWVVPGTRFFLQDVSKGEPGITMATLTAQTAASPDPAVVHYLAVSATSYNPSIPEPTGAILLFDRDTGDQFARFHFDAPARAVDASSDGATLYVAVMGNTPGIAVIDVTGAQTGPFIAVPKLGAAARLIGSTLLVGTYEPAIAVIDLTTTRVDRTLPCPAAPERVVDNPRAGATYWLSTISNRICVVTRDLGSAAPISLPQPPSSAVLLDNGGAGVLLVSSWDNRSAYATGALDLQSLKTFDVPSLEGATSFFLGTEEPPLLYAGAAANGARVTQPYTFSFAADGAPVFTRRGEPIPIGFAVSDDRFFYTGVPGYCSTLEGPVICSVGFRAVDRATLLPGPSFVFARSYNSLPDLFGARAISLDLASAGRFPAARARPSPGIVRLARPK
jgi:hypothetical protein